MKKLKGFISILLSVVLMLSSVCSINLFAYAEENHDYVLNQVEPTITTQGYDEYVCSNCGDSYRVNERYLSIQLGETTTINLGAGETAMLQFTPDTDVSLVFSSSGGYDTYGKIYDSEMNVLSSDDDSGTNNNFLVKYNFIANNTYILTCNFWNQETFGMFEVSLMPNPADKVDSIEFTPAEPYEIIQNTSGRENDGVWKYNPPRFNNGDTLTVHNIDGSTLTYTFSEDNSAFFSEAGNRVDVNSSSFVFEGIGETEFNIFVPLFEKQASVPVTIIENPYASFEYVSAKGFDIIEGTRSHELIDNEDNVYNLYYELFSEGDKIIVTTKDSQQIEFTNHGGISYSSSYSSCFFESVSGEEFEARINHNQSNNHWIAGNSYDLEIEFLGMKTGVTYNIIENPVASIEFTPITQYEIVQNTNGEDWGNGWYYNAPRSNEGDKITIYYTDGHSDDYIFNSNNSNNYRFYNSNGEELDVERYSFQFDGVGETTFKVYLPSIGKSTYVPVTITENPVSSIEFTPITQYEIVQNTNGEDWGDGWYYNAPSSNEGDKITIYYTDGHSEEYIYNINNHGFYNSNGEALHVERYSFQFDGVGETTFEVYLPSFGKRTSVPVTIIENPISNIEFTPIKPYEIIQNTNGYEDWDGNWCYNAPDFENGDSIKIYYTDGHTEQYTFNYRYNNFIDESNTELPAHGRSFFFDGIGETTFDVVINDIGRVSVPVTIIESPVTEIEFIPANNFEYIENIHCSIRQGEDGEYTHYNNLFNKGDRIIITTKDGESKTYTHKGYGSSSSSDDYEITEFLNEKDEVINVGMYHNQPTEHWTLGNQYEVTITCLGARKNYNISIVESPIASTEINLTKPITIIKDTNGYRNQETEQWIYESIPFSIGDEINILYKDGSIKTFTYHGFSTDENWNEFFDENENQLAYILDSFTFDGVGETTVEMKLDDYGQSISIPITIIEDDVVRITATPVTKIVERNGGYCDWLVSEDGVPYPDNIYYYYTIHQKIDITVYYKDGTTKTFKNVENYDNIDSVDVGFWFDNATSETYKAGDKLIATVNFGSDNANRTCTVEFEIEENPVENVNIVQNPITEQCHHFGGQPAGKCCIYCASKNAQFEFVLKDGTTETIMGKDLLMSGMGGYSSSFYPGNSYAHVRDYILDIAFYKSDLSSEICQNGDTITYYVSGITKSVALEIPTNDEHTHSWSEWTVKTPAVYKTSDTVMTRTCSTCNETEDYEVANTRMLRVNAINLTLGSNIAVNAKINKTTVDSDNFARVYCVVEKIRSSNGDKVATTIDESEFINGTTPRMQFVYEEMNPQNMMDTYDITFYAVTTDGIVAPGPTYSYSSIAQYAKTEITKASNASKTNYKRMLVDMLKYGAQAQLYMGYDTDTLATSVLTAEELALGSSVTVPSYEETQDTRAEEIANPTRAWRATGLVLDSAVRVRLRLGGPKNGTPMTEEDLQNTAVRVVVEGGVSKLYKYEENPELFVPAGETLPNQYYFYFNDLAVSQIRNNVYYTICDKDGNALSNTLLYKPETFVINPSPASLKPCLDAMMVYADSCRDYVAAPNN